ncbi:MAG: serine acetyltransferase [Lachnospiraceae bacterium]|nr:serine acetyltransferase [Lachnospiraceae bacterium]
MDIKKVISKTASELDKNYQNQGIFEIGVGEKLPKRSEIISILEEIRRLIFPGYFGTENTSIVPLDIFAGNELSIIYEKLYKQIKIAILFSLRDKKGEKGSQEPKYNGKGIDEATEELTLEFIKELPKVQNLILKDVEAELQGDPAASSLEEIIFSYPGIYAISIYRVAHVLYELKIPFIPRIMTEHAHSKTGIDINPGATIGEYFFIDHGTGIVIGETTTIGNHVKIYQGVTLGALSTMKGQELSGVKRHPTIEDDVVVYANTTILGGETVVGKGSVVAGNTFLTQSVPENTTVSAYMPELKLKARKAPKK